MWCKGGCALLVTVALSLSAAAQSGNAPELPAGPVQGKVQTACLECHDAHIILQQRLGKAAWTKEVDKMTKWGALVNPSDHDAFVDYLSTNFPADKPAYVAWTMSQRPGRR
ncbi:MAG: hypothetical protein H0X25_14585 [Acidobacteriales bacterium]|nr:hypothetical protein [Terriglobales bacterium]